MGFCSVNVDFVNLSSVMIGNFEFPIRICGDSNIVVANSFTRSRRLI